jgi:hypothetical protein
LQGKRITGIVVESLGPKMRVGLRIDQMSIDAEAI